MKRGMEMLPLLIGESVWIWVRVGVSDTSWHSQLELYLDSFCRAVWHQADPITDGTRWALVIFYKVQTL
jgi:hypothetical protein